MEARERWIVALLLTALWTNNARSYPLIIAHRGSPCAYPEETIESFQQAIDDKADYIEMDVVSSKDGILVCRHDLTLDSTTDVAQREEFNDRKTTRTLPNGQNQTGYFVADFTVEELKQLWAVQSMPFRDHSKDSMYRIATFAEVLTLAIDSNKAGKPIGVYVEAKEAAFHNEVLALPLESKIVTELMSHGVQDAGLHVILQSFEKEALRSMSTLLKLNSLTNPTIPLVWLLGCDSNVTEEELEDFATFGNGIGPDKNLLVPLENTPECGQGEMCSFHPNQQCTGRIKGGPAPPDASDNSLLAWAKARQLVVHAYTFRNEDMFMAIDFRGDPHAELEYFGAQEGGLGLDGVFVDCTQTAIRWRQTQPSPKPHQYLPDLSDQQKPAPPWVSIIVVLAGVLLVFGAVIWVACFLINKKTKAYELLSESDDIELPVSRRAIADPSNESPSKKTVPIKET